MNLDALDSANPSEQVGTRLLFENDRVRVWDLYLAPGAFLETHIHRHDYLFVVAAGGDLRHVDLNNPANDRAVRYEEGQVVFLDVPDEGIVHNRLVNTGTQPYRNFVIELKTSPVGTD